MRWRVEVGVLALDPREEAADARIGPDRGDAVAKERELGIGKGPVERPMADRMDGHGFPTAAALRNGVMIFDALTERSRAQPTTFFGCSCHSS